MKFMKSLDGYKRVIVLALYLVAALVKASGHGDYEGYLGMILRILDWTPDLSPVPMSVIAGTAAGAYAIYDGVKKALTERAAAKARAELYVTPRP